MHIAQPTVSPTELINNETSGCRLIERGEGAQPYLDVHLLYKNNRNGPIMMKDNPKLIKRHYGGIVLKLRSITSNTISQIYCIIFCVIKLILFYVSFTLRPRASKYRFLAHSTIHA